MSEIDWKKLIPRPRSRFLLVACQECNNEQMVFDSAKTKVNCRICGAPLALPRGGKAKILGKVIAVYE